MLSWYVFSIILPFLPAIAAAVLVAGALVVYPEWYVIDATGIIMGAGAAALFGISFGLLPAARPVDCARSIRCDQCLGTEHMLTLASGVMDLRVPVVLVIPMTLSYSYLDATTPNPTAEDETSDDSAAANDDTEATTGTGEADESDDVHADPLERDALFIGLGTRYSVDTRRQRRVLRLIGRTVSVRRSVASADRDGRTFAGLFALLWLVLKGRAHAGLPLLNGGTIGGYIVGALAAGISLVDALGLVRTSHCVPRQLSAGQLCSRVRSRLLAATVCLRPFVQHMPAARFRWLCRRSQRL